MRIALLLILLAPQDNAEWPTYHGGYDLTGVADTKVPEAPEMLWRFKAGKPVEHTPVVGDGRIYFTTRRSQIFAVDMKGNLVWKKVIKPNDFSAPPLYAEKLVIVGTQKGLLIAYDAATGEEKWTFDAEDNIQGSANIVDRKDGKKGVIFISQAMGSIYCVDLQTGKKLWKTKEIDRCDGSASVRDDRIVMGSCASALHVFSVEQQKKTSDIELGEERQVAGGVALTSKVAYAGARDGSFTAVDVDSGKVLWTNKDSKAEAFTTPAVHEKFVLFASDDRKIYGLDRTTGKTVWTIDTEGLPWSPVIAGDRVVVSSGGSLFLLNVTNGDKVWSGKVSDEITSPAVVKGMIIVGTDEGTVTAYGRK